MLLGAHTSIAGGIDKAIERGDSLHCTAIQIFTKNSNQWKGKTLSPDEVERYHELRKKSKIKVVVAHDSYLINLASGSDELLLLSVLKRQRELSIKEAIAILQFDAVRTREILMRMINRGLLEKSGVKKGLVFRLSGSLCRKLGESINYIRGRGVDEISHPELILEYVKEYGSINNTETRELLGVDINKAYKLLKKLANTGKFIKIGSGNKNAGYTLKK